MALTKWSAFFPYVAPDVYECPEITMEIAVKDAAIEFCRRTFVWQEQLDQVMTIKNINTYDLEVPTGSICENVIDVIVDGKRLTPVKFRDLPPNRETSKGKSLAYSLIFGDQIRLYPTPDSNGKMDITAALTPSNSASGIDSTIFERYKEIIAHGAKHRLMNVPSKSWSNPALGQYHMTQFMRGVGEARLRVDNDQSHVVQTRRFV
jgi:hypothetical protein